MSRYAGLLGIIVFLSIAYLFSTNRRAIRLKTVLWGLGLQFLFAWIVINRRWRAVREFILSGTPILILVLVFKPTGLWKLAKPGEAGAYYEGVKAQFVAVRLSHAQTGTELCSTVTAKNK